MFSTSLSWSVTEWLRCAISFFYSKIPPCHALMMPMQTCASSLDDLIAFFYMYPVSMFLFSRWKSPVWNHIDVNLKLKHTALTITEACFFCKRKKIRKRSEFKITFTCKRAKGTVQLIPFTHTITDNFRTKNTQSSRKILRLRQNIST